MGGEVRNWIALAFFFLICVLTVKVYSLQSKAKSYDRVRFMTRVAIFGAISSILYVVDIFQIHLPFLPSFLALHFDEIPAFIAGFAYGPWAGFAVIAIKTVIKMPFTRTLLVGELSDLVFSTVFVVPAALIYKKRRDLKGVALGFAVSSVLQLIVSAVMNVYAMLPFYIYVMGFTKEGLLALCQLANPAITDLGWTYAAFAVVPLNLIKDAAVIVMTFIVYRSIHKLLHFDHPPKRA
ncbi:MAG: ECF transporter S component [Bacilli bacterium]|jgi:riboflavin transporter FmnP|nr:ECF transporter S component [Bacilli bacterium]